MTGVVIPEMFRSAAAQVREQGWVIEPAGAHLAWVSPDGQVVRSSSTPSDYRALPRHVSALRRAGAVIDGRGAASEPEPQPAELPEPVPEPAPPPPPPAQPEPDGLRELVTEARSLLADLRAERKKIERMHAVDAAELIRAEVARQFAELPVRDMTEAELDKFAQEGGRLLRKLDKAMEVRMGDVNDAIAEIRAVRDRMKGRYASRHASAAPAAYRKTPGPEQRGGAV